MQTLNCTSITVKLMIKMTLTEFSLVHQRELCQGHFNHKLICFGCSPYSLYYAAATLPMSHDWYSNCDRCSIQSLHDVALGP